jgi:hypothetical protein
MNMDAMIPPYPIANQPVPGSNNGWQKNTVQLTG